MKDTTQHAFNKIKELIVNADDYSTLTEQEKTLITSVLTIAEAILTDLHRIAEGIERVS